MTRERNLTQSELTTLFPGGVPLSVRMVVQRVELDSCAKNSIIKQIAAEKKRPPGKRAARRYAQGIGTKARCEALEETLEILKLQLLWAESHWFCNKRTLVNRIRRRIVAAKRKTYEMDDDV